MAKLHLTLRHSETGPLPSKEDVVVDMLRANRFRYNPFILRVETAEGTTLTKIINSYGTASYVLAFIYECCRQGLLDVESLNREAFTFDEWEKVARI